MSQPLPLLRACLEEANGKPGQGKTQMECTELTSGMHRKTASQGTRTAFEDALLLSAPDSPREGWCTQRGAQEGGTAWHCSAQRPWECCFTGGFPEQRGERLLH